MCVIAKFDDCVGIERVISTGYLHLEYQKFRRELLDSDLKFR